jgi:hypothetical protein
MTFDERYVASLLVRITDCMGRPSVDELVDECNAAILACLAVARKGEEEPHPPTTDELVQLAERVVRVGPSERPDVLREIRNALGRLDMYRAV